MKWFDDTDKVSSLPVRAIIATIFTIGVTGGFFCGLLNNADYKELALVALMWYFAKRSADDHNSAADQNGNTPGDEGLIFGNKETPVVNVKSENAPVVNVDSKSSSNQPSGHE